MNPAAVAQARDRLALVQEAVGKMSGDLTDREITRVWADFVQAIARFYSKLEQGSKTTAASRAWWGVQKADRHSDPLLSYLWQARNQDEHGLDPLLQMAAPVLRWEPIDYVVPPERKGKEVGMILPGMPRKMITTLPGSLQLIPVVNRGVSYPVPGSHHGVPFAFSSVPELAALALQTLESMLSEAQSLCVG